MNIAMVPAVDIEKEILAVRASQRALVEIERTRDIERSLTYFSADVIIHEQDKPVARGIAAMRAVYEQFLPLPWARFICESTDTLVAASGDLAVDSGWMRFDFPAGSPHTELFCKYISILRKLDGAWKIVINNVTMDHKV